MEGGKRSGRPKTTTEFIEGAVLEQVREDTDGQEIPFESPTSEAGTVAVCAAQKNSTSEDCKNVIVYG